MCGSNCGIDGVNVLESPDVLSVIARQANVYTQEGNVAKLAEMALRVAGGVRTQDIPVERLRKHPCSTGASLGAGISMRACYRQVV